MDVKPQIKKVFLLIWVLLVPAGMWFTYKAFPPSVDGLGLDLFLFLILVSAVAAMPMVINNIPVFLIQWVSLAVFLSFGLFVEMVFAQIAIIVLLLKVKVTKEQWFRIPMNTSMFFIISLVTGSVYYLLGGETGRNLLHEPSLFWLAGVYIVVSYTINQAILAVILSVIYGSTSSFFGKSFIWETVTTLITAPIGLVLYVLYQEVGVFSVLFVGIPFASLSIILNLYYSSEKINEYLQKATEIGHQLAERLQVNDVIDLFIQKLSVMLQVDYAYIIDIVEDKELQLIRRIENGQVMPNNLAPVLKNKGIIGRVWSTRKSALYSSKREWKKIVVGYMPEQVESVLSVPIVRNSQVVGVLVLASKRKRAYEKSQLMIVDILCSHFAIAIENAKHHELTKENSERCGLTKLHNYRYFENVLTHEFNSLRNNRRDLLSLIILDLDHFKVINDTYGHQSGNEILYELASRLEKLVGNRGTVARYGGEEFVVLLPDTNKKEAIQIAELIRQTIANRSFELNQHLHEDKKQLLVSVTASLGVATAPQDADDSLALIRHADRALYVGAKKAGRNRVAEYVK